MTTTATEQTERRAIDGLHFHPCRRERALTRSRRAENPILTASVASSIIENNTDVTRETGGTPIMTTAFAEVMDDVKEFWSNYGKYFIYAGAGLIAFRAYRYFKG